MRKFVAMILALVLMLTVVQPVSAVTAGKWNLDAGLSHARSTGQEMARKGEIRIIGDWLITVPGIARFRFG